MSFWPEDGFENKGYVYCYLNPDSYEGSVEQRDSLVKKLNQLSIFNYNPEDIISGKDSEGPLDALSEHELFIFIDILEDYCIDDRFSVQSQILIEIAH